MHIAPIRRNIVAANATANIVSAQEKLARRVGRNRLGVGAFVPRTVGADTGIGAKVSDTKNERPITRPAREPLLMVLAEGASGVGLMTTAFSTLTTSTRVKNGNYILDSLAIFD